MSIMADVKKQLEEIGLSDKEAAVYVASLELGKSPVQKIAQQAGIKRVTTYVIIEALMKKGLMSSMEEGKKTHFFAEDPTNIERLIVKQQETVEEKKRLIKDIIPQLDILFKTIGERPAVRFFEGVEGLMSVREDILKSEYKEGKSFVALDSLLRLFPKQEHMTKSRIKRGIKGKVLYTHPRGPIPGGTDTTLLRETKWIPREHFEFNGDISVYGNKVSISTFQKKPIAIIIESREIALIINAIFDLAWGGADKFDKKY